MKTLTEFFGRNLKSIEEQMTTIQADAARTAGEALKAEGKSDEEIQTALPEATQAAVNAKLTELTKMEGDKLTWLMTALEMIKNKRGNIKRVLVMSANEGEKAPAGLQEIDGKFFSVEFFPEMTKPAARTDSRDDRRGGRGGRDGKGRGGKGGRDGKGRDGGGRGRRDFSGAPGASEGAPSTEGGRPPRGRGPRREGAGSRAPLTEEQKAARDAARAERDAARAAKNAEFAAKREAAAAAEPQYDGKTNRIKPRAPGSAPVAAPAEQTASE